MRVGAEVSASQLKGAQGRCRSVPDDHGHRHLYIARHGEADAFGALTDIGREQSRLLGRRLSHLSIDAVWHSPLARASDSARQLAIALPATIPLAEAAELVDHVPYIPDLEETPGPWVPFFDGWDADVAEAEHAIAVSLIERFATAPAGDEDIHEILVTHAYPIAWLIRHALDAPAVRWLGLDSANTGLTVIEYRPALPPSIIMVNDMSHLRPELRWTGFPETPRP